MAQKRFHRHFEPPGLPLYWIIIAYIILGWFFPVIGLLALICMIGHAHLHLCPTHMVFVLPDGNHLQLGST